MMAEHVDGAIALLRPTSRLLVLDQDGRTLLFQIEDDTVSDPRRANHPAVVWTTPGGGVDPGESYEAAALRELFEETGIAADDSGPCVFEEEILLYFAGQPVRLQQRYFVISVTEPILDFSGFDDAERSVHRAHRWWSLTELETTAEDVFPPQLAELVRAVLRQA